MHETGVLKTDRHYGSERANSWGGVLFRGCQRNQHLPGVQGFHGYRGFVTMSSWLLCSRLFWISQREWPRRVKALDEDGRSCSR